MAESIDVVAPTGEKWEGNKSCATCMHKKDVLDPCDWLYRQKHVVLNCPYYERGRIIKDDMFKAK